ncbi:MAG: PKD domain-containing protein, partial [Myxococcota bacterium]
HANAIYVAFGRAMGYMTAPWDATLSSWLDVHGAGAQRSDPKNGDPAQYAQGNGPQGDAIRIHNFVRLVRTATATPASTQPHAAFSWSPSLPKQSESVQFNDLSDGAPTSWAWTFGDGGTSDKASPTHVFAAKGAFPVTLTIQSAQGTNSLTRTLTVSTLTSGGPVACSSESDCSLANACPPDATQGCGCTAGPNGKACIPKCSVAGDCPAGPGVAFKCTGGFCVP